MFALALVLVAALALPAASTTAQDTSGMLARPASDSLPLRPTRTVRFTTTEGTWLSLDVSPDGRTLLFDLLGDLYTLPIGGGRATRLTEGPAWDAQPRYAPDGRSIAYQYTPDSSVTRWGASGPDEYPS